MPLPQNRQAPTAVLRQCQQSILYDPLLELSTKWLPLMVPHAVQGDRGVDRPLPERVLDDPVEAIPVQPESSHRRERSNRGGPGDVEEKRDLAEVAPRPHGPDLGAVFEHLDLAGAEGVEGVP